MKSSVLIKILSLFVALLLILMITGCGSTNQSIENTDDSSLQKVIDAGEFVLGLDTEFPPMGFIDEKGDITGFDIDVAQEVCDRLGVDLVKKGINWDKKEDVLNSGEIDCIWNGLSVTETRSQTMNMSDPYMKNQLIIVVPSYSDIKSINGLKGNRVGVQKGSTAYEITESNTSFSEVSVKEFDTVMIMLQDLENRDLDAVLIDSVAAYYYIFSRDEKYYILSDCLEEEEYAIGFRKDDQKLRDKVQEIISGMKADGTLGDISEKWFGSDITIVK